MKADLGSEVGVWLKPLGSGVICVRTVIDGTPCNQAIICLPDEAGAAAKLLTEHATGKINLTELPDWLRGELTNSWSVGAIHKARQYISPLWIAAYAPDCDTRA